MPDDIYLSFETLRGLRESQLLAYIYYISSTLRSEALSLTIVQFTLIQYLIDPNEPI